MPNLSDQVFGVARWAANGLGFRAWVLWTAVAVLIALAPSAVAAQEGLHDGIRISFTADRAELTVGEVVNLTLEVTHPADHIVVVPRLGPQWGPFEVISQTPVRTEPNRDGTETTRQGIEVTLFAPGTFETPRLSLSVRSPEGVAEQVFPTPALLTVSSVLPGPDEELKDIRPPADVSLVSLLHPVALAVAALVVVASLAAGWYFSRLRHRDPDKQTVSAEDTRTPGEVAVQELDRIGRLYLPAEGRFEEHYALIAEAVKAYLQATYLEDAGGQATTELTTDETIDALRRSPLGRGDVGRVAELLLETDIVRFSGYTPQVSQAHDALVLAQDIVEKDIAERARPARAAGQRDVTA